MAQKGDLTQVFPSMYNKKSYPCLQLLQIYSGGESQILQLGSLHA